MRFKKLIGSFLLTVLLFVSVSSVLASENENLKGSRAKNVIIFISDGTSVGGYTLARWYQGGKPFATDELLCGLVRTYASDSIITDSAPGSTAFSTGFKTHTGFVGVMPDVNDMPGLAPLKKEDIRKPVATVLEGAKLAGKSTGLVATVQFVHATPADFAAHTPYRNSYDVIAEQMIYNNVDVVLGGGTRYVTNRKDGEDMVNILKSRGYEYATTRDEMKKLTADKYYGLFCPVDMRYDFDRPSNEPTLAEMTEKAIGTLSKNKKGFFLMVEGSKVDWAAHENDPIGIVSDILAFDKAVATAVDFAKKNRDTVVIVTSDHGNSGLSIGNKKTDYNYDTTAISTVIPPLKKAIRTGEGLEPLMDKDRSNLVEVMANYYGISDLTKDEIERIQKAKPGKMNTAVGEMMARRSNIGFTTYGHTGEDVILGVYAPDGVRPTGVIDNTDVAKYMANTLRIDMDKLNKKLFVVAIPALEKKGATVVYDTKTDPNNPVLIATKGKNEYRFPMDKSVAFVNGKEVQLSGISIHNTIEPYIPQDAVNLVK